MKKIRTAIFGTGFMGRVHTEAVRRLGNVEVAAIAARTADQARKFADTLGIESATGDYTTILNDPEIEAVHVCAPNALHFEMTKSALQAGKHVVCEKPLASTISEAQEMVDLAKARNLANCTLYNIRFYPQIQNMLHMREAGEFGEIQIVQGTYSQDWLLYDTDWNWRIESGPSRAFADIGTHWCDLAEYLTGLKITSVCAELETFRKARKRPKHSIETFAGKKLQPSDYDEVPVKTEDFCSMMFHMGEGVRGSMTASQVSAGRKNFLSIELYGTKASAAWNAERPDELWVGNRNSANELYIKDPSLMRAGASQYADLPGGHSEGYDDTFKQILRQFYKKVADSEQQAEFPTFVDGIRQLYVLNAVLESAAKRAWVDVAGGDW
ncbi:Gfo/Idh/MocA family oxidoreductase [Acidipila sp. 4G-K13]|uniref:Gfo/Idh/MocA family oxidoreductase n=2 Tax=Paracidobacterium acidisoli TaxID=2303751 RepID=A0A372ILK2_9BACT|nr:Gfo/Idh/MocA family oxidoreductase [Paracidobacterium acidisoli]